MSDQPAPLSFETVSGLAAFTARVAQLAASAHAELTLFSHELDYRVYGSEEFSEIIKKFILQHRRARLRVLHHRFHRRLHRDDRGQHAALADADRVSGSRHYGQGGVRGVLAASATTPARRSGGARPEALNENAGHASRALPLEVAGVGELLQGGGQLRAGTAVVLDDASDRIVR